MDRGWDRDVFRSAAVLGQHREHLLDVQRVSLCSVGDAEEQVCGQLLLAAEEVEQGFGLGLGQRVEDDCGGVRRGGEPARVLL